MIKLRHLDTGPCELYLKLESANPAARSGPHRPVDDRSSGESRQDPNPATPWSKAPPATPASAWRWWRRPGLPADPRGAGQDEPREDLQPEGDGRGSGADPLGRGQGPSAVLPGHGRNASRARHPARTPSASSATRTTARITKPPARKSCARWTGASMPSCSAAARPAR